MGAFTHDGRAVFWGTVRLPVQTIEDLLTLFDDQGAVRPYLDLHDAYVATGGVPRVSASTAIRKAA